MKQDETSVGDLDVLFESVKDDLQRLGDTESAAKFLKQVSAAYQDKHATLLNPAKQLEVIGRSLEKLPSSADLRQQYETIRTAINSAPTKKSELKGYWAKFYEANEAYNKLENFFTENVESRWLAAEDKAALTQIVDKLSESRKSATALPLTDLDAALATVEQKRSSWEIVKNDFKKFHGAINNNDITVAELEPLYSKLKNGLNQQSDTETGHQLIQHIFRAYQEKVSSK